MARREKIASQGAGLKGPDTKLLRRRGFFALSVLVALLSDWV